MRTLPKAVRRSGIFSWLEGDDGLPGRVILAWAIAGGLGMEALSVVSAFMSGRPGLAAGLAPATVFFWLGAAAGLVHGLIASVAGRPLSARRGSWGRSTGLALALAVPALAVAWLASVWLSMTAMAVQFEHPAMILQATAGWAACGVAAIWALAEARASLRNALVRWPERRPGQWLLTLTFVTLLVVFVWLQPELWFTDIRVTRAGAMILALGATVWVALPLEVILLRVLHLWSWENPIWSEPVGDPGVG